VEIGGNMGGHQVVTRWSPVGHADVRSLEDNQPVYEYSRKAQRRRRAVRVRYSSATHTATNNDTTRRVFLQSTNTSRTIPYQSSGLSLTGVYRDRTPDGSIILQGSEIVSLANFVSRTSRMQSRTLFAKFARIII
jgi:hypothetical protein